MDSDGIVLQVLGSGGPIADDDRASSGYLVWVDGKARVMVDAGTGSVLRFGEAGAKFEDLDFVGLMLTQIEDAMGFQNRLSLTPDFLHDVTSPMIEIYTTAAADLDKDGDIDLVLGGVILGASDQLSCPESLDDRTAPSAPNIDPEKIGRTLRGLPIYAADSLPDLLDRDERSVVVSAVSSRGARQLIRQRPVGRDKHPDANSEYASEDQQQHRRSRPDQ